MIKLNAKKLRKSKPAKTQIAKIKRRGIYIICDNILDTYNIGSIFRLADAVSAKKIYLCGATETPPNSRISKASVGTDKWVPWEYASTVVEAIQLIRNSLCRPSIRSSASYDRESLGAESSGRTSDPRLREDDSGRSREDDKGREIKVIAIEQSPKAVDYRKVDYKEPMAFVIGHETSGVTKEALKVCDQIVEIPMFGVNRSLNVMVSLAVVLYHAIGKVYPELVEG